MMSINFNERIGVKLTELGKGIYLHQYDCLNKQLKSRGCKPYPPRPADVDEDGLTYFQFWQFMNLYGEYMTLTYPNVIEDGKIYMREETLREEVSEDDQL